MASEFLDSVGVIHIGFLAHDVTINAQYYSNLLRSDFHQAIRKERRRKLSKKIFVLHDSIRSRAADLTKATLATLECEIMNDPRYSLDLASSDFHLLGSIRMHL
jgi:hypothetical protein